MNELLMICILLIGIISLYLFNKILDTFGMKIVFIIFSTITYLVSFKYLELSTFHINASILTFCTSYTCLSLLLEKNLVKEVKQVIKVNLILNILTSILLYIMAYYTQSINDTVAINMSNIILDNVKLLIIYPIATYISHEVFIYVYLKVKKLYDYIFISMVSTYMASGLVGILLTHFIAYFNILSLSNIIKLLLSTYMVELIIIVIYATALTIISSKKVSK